VSARRERSGDAPLLALGEALRRAKLSRRRRNRRIVLVGAGAACLLATIALPPAPRLVWNASASAPEGLYAVSPGTSPGPGDMVIAWAPVPYRRLAARRHYLPINVPLVKRVTASAGDQVCAIGTHIIINGRPVAERRTLDDAGRPMPGWTGCFRLRGSQLFLLMDDPASFDGRYFGVTEGTDVIGKARLLWRR
jgi:conjugative transfer signal peptidase TraF